MGIPHYDFIECGECSEVLKRYDDKCIDMVLTSPPYDSLRTYKGYSWDFENVAKELARVLKDGGVIVWIVNDATVNGSETGTSFRQALYFMDLGLNLHDTMIWKKPTFTATGSLKYRYAPVFEYMFVFSKGKIKTFHPIKDRKTIYPNKTYHGTVRNADGTFKEISGAGIKKTGDYGQRFNVWECPTLPNRERTGHPAQFPVKLAKDHIISWSNEGDVVLDPFMGSGTTAIACIESNRHYIGIDISKEYCELAENRIKDAKMYEVNDDN